MVGVPALLALARWHRGRRLVISGVEPCPRSRMGPPSPPSPDAHGASRPTEAALESSAGGNAPSGAAVPGAGGDSPVPSIPAGIGGAA